MTNRIEFDQILVPFLDLAHELSGQALALIDRLLPEEATGAAMPEAAVHRLHIASTVSYRSGLMCLLTPETSLSAFTLLRGILEAWSHLDFISDDTAGGDARCRALRYERGVMKEWANNVRVVPAGFDHDTWRRQHGENEREIEALWREFGCKGPDRTQGNCAHTLTKLAQKPTMDWIPGVWRSSSATTHMYGVDFALLSRGDGTTDLVWALPSHRVTWLIFLVASYGYLTTTAAEVLRPKDLATARFHHAVRSLAEDSELRRALTGEYDSEA